jgi:hypothetical protein
MTSSCTLINLLKHQATGFEGRRLRIEWRQASSDQIGVNESERLGFSGQKVTGKRCFSSAVGSRDDDDFFKFGSRFGNFMLANTTCQPIDLGNKLTH